MEAKSVWMKTKKTCLDELFSLIIRRNNEDKKFRFDKPRLMNEIKGKKYKDKIKQNNLLNLK